MQTLLKPAEGNVPAPRRGGLELEQPPMGSLGRLTR